MPAPLRRLEINRELEWEEGDNHLDPFDTPVKRVVTIASGIITITGPGVWHVETEGAALTDDLTGIIGGQGRLWPITLMLNTDGRVITVRHTPPNLMLQNSADFILNTLRDTLPLKDRTNVEWFESPPRCSVP